MSAPAHALELEDRGSRRTFRWVATCRCGWSAIPLRLKVSAVRGYRGHVRTESPRPRRRRPPMPRPLTPDDRLPPALRSRGAA